MCMLLYSLSNVDVDLIYTLDIIKAKSFVWHIVIHT